jgi:superfamily II DNA or RNA helicase
VDRVEVHEQTSDGTFGGHCPEGVVYNLTVEETPTFTVGKSKIVVHNCHHLSAREFCKTADLFPGRRYGTTATVQRGDGSEVVFLWHLGPVIHSNLTQDLAPTVTFLMSPSQVDLQDREVQERVLDVGGNVHSRRLINYVACLDEELEFVAGHIREALTAGRKILALSLSKDQLGLLHDMFPESGLIRGDVKGSEVRRRALKEHQLCFGTTDLAKEALDDRKLDALFVLTEFVKEGMLQQAVGRIQRIMDGKKNPRVVVIRHRKVTKLERMAKRMQSYFLKQGFKVEVAR